MKIIKENYFEDPVFVTKLDDFINRNNKRENQLNLSKAAILVLDMQNYFTQKQSHAYIPAADNILLKILPILKEWIARDHMVVITRHLNKKGYAGNMEKWWRDLIEKKNPLSEICDSLKYLSKEPLVKHQYDAFFQTNLEELLIKKGINQVIISGVMTHLCCETTARSAFMRGFEVFLLGDGMGTYNRDYHFSTLINLSHGFGKILKCEELYNLIIKEGL